MLSRLLTGRGGHFCCFSLPAFPAPQEAPASSAQALLTLLLLWNLCTLAALLPSSLLILRRFVSFFTLQCQDILLGVRRCCHRDGPCLCFSSSSLVVFFMCENTVPRSSLLRRRVCYDDRPQPEGSQMISQKSSDVFIELSGDTSFLKPTDSRPKKLF